MRTAQATPAEAATAGGGEWYNVLVWGETTFIDQEYSADYRNKCLLPRHAIYARTNLPTLLQPPMATGHGGAPPLDTTALLYLKQLMRASEQGKPAFDAECERILASVQATVGDGAAVTLHLSSLKKTRRINVKAKSKYERRFDKVLDIVRGTFVGLTIAVVGAVFAALVASERFVVVRVKNRLQRCFDASESSHYRSVHPTLGLLTGSPRPPIHITEPRRPSSCPRLQCGVGVISTTCLATRSSTEHV